MDQVEAGTYVGIYAEGKEHCMAIGITKMSTDEIIKENYGQGIDLITYLNDDLWKLKEFNKHK